MDTTMSNRPEYAFAHNSSEVGGWPQTSRSARFNRAARGPDFEPGEHRRRVAQVELTIAEMETAAAQLDREIEAEQTRSRIHDPTHYAYPTYAKAAIVRRDNLRRSIQRLKEYI
jgi:hypothetical protein